MNLNFIKNCLTNYQFKIDNSISKELLAFANFIYYYTIAETIFVSTLVVILVFMVSIGLINLVYNNSMTGLLLNYLLILLIYFNYIAIKAVFMSYSLMLKKLSHNDDTKVLTPDNQRESNE